MKIVCKNCNKKFKTFPCRRAKFCSMKCYSRVGNKNPSWKGGSFRDKKHGYIFTYSPNHPHANNNGYVREHRLVMEKKIGRYLKKEEVVHHINEIRDDNRPENLELCESSGKHFIQRHLKRRDSLGRFAWA